MVSQKKDLSAAVTAMAIPGVEDKHHIVGKKLSLQSTYCHSYNEAVYAMTNNLDGVRLKNSFEEAGFKTATANPSIAEIRVALSTERTNEHRHRYTMSLINLFNWQKKIVCCARLPRVLPLEPPMIKYVH